MLNGSGYNDTYKLMRKVVYGATAFCSFMVFFLSITLIMHHTFAFFFIAVAFITNGFLLAFCDYDEFFNPGRIKELFVIFFLWIAWIVVGGVAVDGISSTGTCSRSVKVEGQDCHSLITVAVLGFLNGLVLLGYNVVFYYRESPLGNCNPCCCGVSILQGGRNIRRTAIRSIGMSTLEDGRDSDVSTMEDGSDAELTALRNNSMSSLEDGRDTEFDSVACLPWRMVPVPSSRR